MKPASYNVNRLHVEFNMRGSLCDVSAVALSSHLGRRECNSILCTLQIRTGLVSPNTLCALTLGIAGFFLLCPSFGILENTTFRKLDLFPSSGGTYSVGPLGFLRGQGSRLKLPNTALCPLLCPPPLGASRR
jgi:hypothetical protein